MPTSIKQSIERLDNVISKAELPDHDSALTGITGLSMYHFYYGKVFDKEEKLELGGELLESVFNRLSNGSTTLTGHSLASGISGLCIALSSLVDDNCIDFDIDENLGSFDDYLVTKSKEELAQKEVDFLHQSLGVVYYFTTRKTTPQIKEVLEGFVDDIFNASIQNDSGTKFLNSSGPRAGSSYDLSVAHGLAGILIILLNIYKLGIRQDEIKDFVRSGIKYILNFHIENPSPNKPESLFALGIDKEGEKPQYSNMLAWCYGDLNQLALLINASKILGTSEFDSIIKNVTKRVCSRSIDESLVRDSHFCHGASGVCYVFKYLYEISGNEAFLTAKNKWLDVTLNLLEKDLKSDIYKQKETQFLEGLVGVGFVLLSEVSDQKLSWSKLLLM